MPIQTKTFYADLFSKSPSTATADAIKARPAPKMSMAPKTALKTAPATQAIKAMAPLHPALSSKARSPDELPRQAAQETAQETAREIKTDPAAALPVPVPALPVPAGVLSANQTAEAPAPQKSSALMKLIGDADIHDMSPRQMTHLSQTLYAAGALSFEDYSQLAFQPELHPDFERTIGALTGEQAAPDRRRDFVTLWNERADFQRRHNSGRPDLIEQSERIASVLSRIETPRIETARIETAMNVMA